jgi:hypothetical protein
VCETVGCISRGGFELRASFLNQPSARRDAIILLSLGLAVDLRWFERAWPGRFAAPGKLLLVNAALYGFVAIRRGFDFHFHWSDWKTGTRELVFCDA